MMTTISITISAPYVTLDELARVLGMNPMQNETIDALAYQVFGRTAGIVEIIYQNNPKLCELPAILPMGTDVNVTEMVAKKTKNTFNLWD